MKENKFFQQNSIVHFSLNIGVILLTIRLIVMSYLFVRISSVSVRCLFVDSVLDIIMILCSAFIVRKTESHPNVNYPYGFGKITYLWNLVQGSLLFFLGVNLFFDVLKTYNDADKLLLFENSSYLSFVAAAITFLVFLIELYSNFTSSNDVINANMLNRIFDLVNYLLGYFSVYLLNKGYFGLDYLLASAIVFFMCLIGIRIFFKSCTQLCDKSVPKKLHDSVFLKIEELIGKENPLKIRKLRIIQYGQWCNASIEIHAPEHLTVSSVNSKFHYIKENLNKIYPNINVSFVLSCTN